MRTSFIWVIFIVFAALLEAQWPYFLRVQGVVPQLVLVLVVYFAMNDSTERAMFTGVLGGLFQEVAADEVLGHRILCLVVVGFVAGTLSRRLIIENPAVKAGAIIAASFIHGVLYLLIDYIQWPGSSNVHAQLAALFPQACYTALVAPGIFLALSYTPMPQQRRVV